MLVTLLSFTAEAVGVKALAADIETAEILFLKSLIGLLVVLSILSCKGLDQLKTRTIRRLLALGGFLSVSDAIALAIGYGALGYPVRNDVVLAVVDRLDSEFSTFQHGKSFGIRRC